MSRAGAGCSYPLLLVSNESLGELNRRLKAADCDAVPMDRFRPNVCPRALHRRPPPLRAPPRTSTEARGAGPADCGERGVPSLWGGQLGVHPHRARGDARRETVLTLQDPHNRPGAAPRAARCAARAAGACGVAASWGVALRAGRDACGPRAQATGFRSEDVLLELSKFRRKSDLRTDVGDAVDVFFGQNVCHTRPGAIRVGDKVWAWRTVYPWTPARC